MNIQVKQSSENICLVIYNNEKWYNAKNVYVEWDRFVATPNVSNELFRQFSEWNKDNKSLQLIGEKSATKNNSVDIGRKKFREFLLFRLDKGDNEFEWQGESVCCDEVKLHE